MGVIRFAPPACDAASNRRHTMFAMLLPFNEHGNLYGGLNFDFGASSIWNITAQQKLVQACDCPSDEKSTGPLNPAGGPLTFIGVNQSSYAGNAGTIELFRCRYATANAGNCRHFECGGNFVISWNYGTYNITDGTSNTFFVGEASRFRGQPAFWQFPWNYGEWFQLVVCRPVLRPARRTGSPIRPCGPIRRCKSPVRIRT